MLRVSAASAPMSPASAHRSRRANQNADTDSSRNGDSEYGARKKNAVGKIATNRIVVLATRGRPCLPAASARAA